MVSLPNFMKSSQFIRYGNEYVSVKWNWYCNSIGYKMNWEALKFLYCGKNYSQKSVFIGTIPSWVNERALDHLLISCYWRALRAQSFSVTAINATDSRLKVYRQQQAAGLTLRMYGASAKRNNNLATYWTGHASYSYSNRSGNLAVRCWLDLSSDRALNWYPRSFRFESRPAFLLFWMRECFSSALQGKWLSTTLIRF
jgi:hypothetical protein